MGTITDLKCKYKLIMRSLCIKNFNDTCQYLSKIKSFNMRVWTILFLTTFLSVFNFLPNIYAQKNTSEVESHAIGMINMEDNIAIGVLNTDQNKDNDTRVLNDSLSSAEKGSVSAQVFVADHYKKAYKKGLRESDSSECIKWYTVAADNGSNDALIALADIYYPDTLANNQNIERAIELLEKSVENGDKYAMYKLGTIYGNRNEKALYDPSKAFEWYMKGEKIGSPECAYGLGSIYSQEDAPYGKNIPYAVYFLEKYINAIEKMMAGESKDDDVNAFIIWPEEYRMACRLLGSWYKDGYEIEKNPIKGEILIKKSQPDNFKSADEWKYEYDRDAKSDNQHSEDILKYWIGHWYSLNTELNDGCYQMDLYKDGSLMLTEIQEQWIPLIGKIKISISQRGTYDVTLTKIKFKLDKSTTCCKILELGNQRVNANSDSSKENTILTKISNRLNGMFQESDEDIFQEFNECMIIIAPTCLDSEEISQITLTFCFEKEDQCKDVNFAKGIGWY